MATIYATPTTERVALNRLIWAGPLAIIVAVIANVLIQQIASAILQPDPAFLALSVGGPIIFTVVGVLGAVIAFGLIARFSRQPITLFRRVALVVLIVSLIPDVMLLMTRFMPGTTTGNVVALMLMHVAAWAISVWILIRFTRD